MIARHRFALSAAALLVATVQPGFSEDTKGKALNVTTPDGLTISAQEYGNPNGPGIVFIHGFSQSHLSWMRQTDGELAKDFHIVTYDLRGHGNSDKLLDAARYRDSKAWGDEVQAVIDAAGLKRPVLVGWSYAGQHRALETCGVDHRLCHDPWRGRHFRHRFRRRFDQIYSGICRRQSEEPAADGVGGYAHQHQRHPRVLARLLFPAAERRRFRDHAGVQHDGAAKGARRA